MKYMASIGALEGLVVRVDEEAAVRRAPQLLSEDAWVGEEKHTSPCDVRHAGGSGSVYMHRDDIIPVLATAQDMVANSERAKERVASAMSDRAWVRINIGNVTAPPVTPAAGPLVELPPVIVASLRTLAAQIYAGEVDDLLVDAIRALAAARGWAVVGTQRNPIAQVDVRANLPTVQEGIRARLSVLLLRIQELEKMAATKRRKSTKPKKLRKKPAKKVGRRRR